ncbi:MAG: HlyC/CorC family transporter [Phycisphaerales bacterium]|nr:HlyC/CorC family transporter [Phycisphaerales bacterium]
MERWLELSLWGVADLIVLTLSAAANLALRSSRARLAEAFEHAGCEERLDRLYALRHQHLLTTGVFRVSAILALVLIVQALLEELQVGADAARPFWSFGIGVLFSAICALAIPSALAKYAGDQLILRTTAALHVIRIVLYPLLLILNLFDPLVRRLAGVHAEDEETQLVEVEREILDVVSEGERTGAVSEDERAMIESVIDLRSTRVEEIMTPRTDVVAIPVEAPIDEIRRVISEQGHSRIPVFEGTIDRVCGILYAKDLLRHAPGGPFDVRAVMRAPHFVPQTKGVRELLREFQQQKVHIAVVLDEYGGTAGLATIEDILEELVGDIADEYEPAEPQPLVQVDTRTYDVDARMSIDELNEELSLNLPESEYYETVGGYVASALGRIPAVGEHCAHEEVELRVIDAEPRKVNRLRVRLPESMIEAPIEERA